MKNNLKPRYISRLLILAAGLLLSIYVRAQEPQEPDTSAIPFVAYWAKGDTYNFKITKTTQSWQEGKLNKDESYQYVARFEVVDSTENSYKIKWVYQPALTCSNNNIPQAFLDRFSKYTVAEVIYQTTETGIFVGIDNWQEIGTMMKAMFSDVVEFLSEDEKTDKEAVKTSMQALSDVYESKEGIEQLAFKELQYFHFPLGLSISTAETIGYEEELPNFFGGDPIRGDAELYIESFDAETAYCVLIQEMKLNPEDTRRLIVDLFKKMGMKDDEMQEPMKTARIEITDRNRYEYFYYPGVPVKIETVRETLIDIDDAKVKRVDKILIELID